MEQFDCTETFFTEAVKQAVEDILVQYEDYLAIHGMNIGMITKIIVELTPKDDRAGCSQNLPRTKDLKIDLIIELALMHKCGIITVLAFSK